MRQRKPPNVGRQTSQHKTTANTHRANPKRHMHPPFVRQLAHGQTTSAKAQHHQGVGQRRIGTRNAKLFLHLWQDNRHHIHAAASQRHEQQGDEEPAGGVRGVDQVDRGGVGRRKVHVSTLSPRASVDAP
jgi:hypothetical protein